MPVISQDEELQGRWRDKHPSTRQQRSDSNVDENWSCPKPECSKIEGTTQMQMQRCQKEFIEQNCLENMMEAPEKSRLDVYCFPQIKWQKNTKEMITNKIQVDPNSIIN